jgi:hypothetical protein
VTEAETQPRECDLTLLDTDTRVRASRQRLYEAMTTPGAGKLSVKALCKKAGVSRQTYYSDKSDPEFESYFRDLCEDGLGGAHNVLRASKNGHCHA